MDGHRYRIEEVEKKTGLTKRMLRYYEELGIIAPNRSEGNYRSYTDEDIESLIRMREKKDKLGFSMAELKIFAGIEKRIVGIMRGETQDEASIRSCKEDIDGLLVLLEDKERIIKTVKTRLAKAQKRLNEMGEGGARDEHTRFERRS
jgi:MerR family transcriptional regulator, repressor of the yfmOP operon